MLSRLAVIILLVMLSSFTPKANEFEAMQHIEKFRKGLADMAASTTSIKANFKQEKYLSILANKIDSEGTILFKKPNLLKWSYTRPFEYTIVLNGKEIIIKDQEKVNSFDIGSSQAFRQINELIINSVEGNILDEARFSIEYLEGKDLYLTKLVPKEAQLKGFIQGIDIYFDKKDFSVSQVKLVESEGDYTMISFFDKKMNENIPDENFSVK